MCDKICEQYDSANPEEDYKNFLKTKPAVNPVKLQYDRLETRKCPYNFKGYGIEADHNPRYRTYNSEYGYYSPNAYTIPLKTFPLSQKFSNGIIRFGMYRNYSLNTQMDKIFQ